MNPEPKLAPAGVIVAVRGSVVDMRFDGALPDTYAHKASALAAKLERWRQTHA